MNPTLSPALRRVRTVFNGDLATYARRPLFAVWALVLLLCAWGFSTGSVRIQSGDATVGGTKSHITSEFAVAMQFAIVTTLFYGFFVAVTAGMAIIQDEEWRIGELLHATPLRPGEYIWAKFAAVVAGSFVMLALHLAAMMFFYHVLPNSDAKEFRGTFHLMNYLVPVLWFWVPMIVFLAGLSFLVGEWTRRPVAVYLLPVAIVLFDAFFLWEWSPSWLDPRINRVLMLLDPAGFRWLSETWLKLDRGVRFYNTTSIPLDPGFLVSRVVTVILGLGAVVLGQRHFAATSRGSTTRSARRAAQASLEAGPPSPRVASRAGSVSQAPLASLQMTVTRPGLLQGASYVARSELAELRSSAGLYLFIPLLLLQTISMALIDVGFLDTPLLVTPVGFAVRAMGTLTTCACLLLLFYTVESLERERSTRLAAIAFATPIRTGSLLLGKLVALGALAMAIVVAVAVGGIIVVLIQGEVGVSLRPMLLYWGLLLLPTILLCIAFVMAIHRLTQSRYATYALALGLIYFTGYRLETNQINWVGNWPMWSAVRDSDISVLELDRRAVVLNRVMALGLAVFFSVLTVRFFRRREVDATQLVHRLRPRAMISMALRLAPWAVVPLFAGIWLAIEVAGGREGGSAKKQAKDYWRKNLATYRDARIPDLRQVTLHLDLFPERSSYRMRGTFDLVNGTDRPLREVLMTGGPHWEKLVWTMDGKPCSPTDRAHLFVFTPLGRALAPGQTVQIGFEHEGTYPNGISERTASSPEFILPSSVVLTSFRPVIVPVLGFLETVGIDDDNRQDFERVPRRLLPRPDRFVPRLPHAVLDADHDHRTGRVHDQLRGDQDVGCPAGRSAHRRLGKRPSGQLLQRGRGPLGGRAWRRDLRILLSRPSLQHRRDPRGPRRGPQPLLPMVLPIPLARAQAERVSQPGQLRSGIPHEHHLLRRNRLPRP